ATGGSHPLFGKVQHLIIGGECCEHPLHADHRLAPDPVLFVDGAELCLQDVVVLGELQHSRLQQHIVEAALLAAPLGRLVVAAAAVPVGVVLLIFRDELPLRALVEDVLSAESGGGGGAEGAGGHAGMAGEVFGLG
ncbi:MAG: hypothetical protein ACK56I_23905, partial [bacterium]